MTLRLIDGFDYLPAGSISTIQAAQGWSGSNDAQRNSNTAFGYGFSMSPDTLSNDDTYYRYLRGRYTSAGHHVFGCRMYIPTVGDDYYLGFHDTLSTRGTQFYIRFDQFGSISLYSMTNGSAALVAKTHAGRFTAARWFWLDLKWTPGTSSTIEIRVNTVPQLTLANVRLSDGTPVLPAVLPGFDHVYFSIARTTGSSNSWAWDDMYFLDYEGTVNNDYLGNVRAKYMPPVSDATPLDWTIGGSAPAATNWESVLNTLLNDTKYVYASTVGFQDLYGIDPNLNTPFVYGIEVSGAYRQDDATQRFVKNTIQSNSVDEDGADHATSQSYVFYSDVFELNPDTGLQFTGAEANALLVGPKVVT